MPVRILILLVLLSSENISLIDGLIASESASAPLDTETASLPRRGICAHRGASATHPENTLAALQEAIRLGAHMVEFDLALTKDSHIVLIHDETIDRTTDGHGRVEDWPLDELRTLDAGSWKAPQFKDERIPTFEEALNILPRNIWINIHLKGDVELAIQTVQEVVAAGRLHQAVLACSASAAAAARTIHPEILICNMDRKMSNEQYVGSTIAQGADFIQLLTLKPNESNQCERLKQHGIRINFCCSDDSETLRKLFSLGVDFVLVDQLDQMLQAAELAGIKRLHPVFATD